METHAKRKERIVRLIDDIRAGEQIDDSRLNWIADCLEKVLQGETSGKAFDLGKPKGRPKLVRQFKDSEVATLSRTHKTRHNARQWRCVL